MPVTASFPNGPASNSCGIAVCNGPDIDGIGSGCGSAGAAGVEVPPEEFEPVADGVLTPAACCPEEETAVGEEASCASEGELV